MSPLPIVQPRLPTTVSRTPNSYIFLATDLALLPVALYFTYLVQALPQEPADLLSQALPILPYILLATGGVSLWLGVTRVQLLAYERHALSQTAIVAVTAGLVEALLGTAFGPQVPFGAHVVFALSYLTFMVLARAVLYQLVLAVYRAARPARHVLIYVRVLVINRRATAM